tara:strand:- start:167 stop:856 length:690 start_codon:yes stop_codon:yes gene_type:complete
MTLAVDSVAYNSVASGNTSFTVTPVGTLDAVIAKVSMDSTSGNVITAITYGGVAMTFVDSFNATAEAQTTFADYILNNPSSGAQTLAVTYSDTSNDRTVAAIGFTTAGGADVEHVSTEKNNTYTTSGSSEPRGSISLTGETCYVSMSFVSGRSSTNGVTQLTNWKDRGESDIGQITGVYDYDILSTTDVTTGLSQSNSDQVVWMATAYKEGVVDSSIIPQIMHHRRQMQ